MSEKALARRARRAVHADALFFDERGKVVARLNGYYPPHRFEAVLDYVAGRHERNESLAAYLRAGRPGSGEPALADEPFFLPPPHDLRAQRRRQAARRAVRDALLRSVRRIASRGLAAADGARAARPVRRRAVRARRAARELTTPDGASATARRVGARARRRRFTPTIVFFAADGREVFRHRCLSAAVPPRVVARLRRERRVSRRAVVPALHPGARRADPRARRDASTCGSERGGAPSRVPRTASSSP